MLAVPWLCPGCTADGYAESRCVANVCFSSFPPYSPQVIGTIDGSGRVVLRDATSPPGSQPAVDLDLGAVLGDMPSKTFRCGDGKYACENGRE